MSSLAEINFNYRKALKQASQLENIARKVKNTSQNELQGILNQVHSAWQSDSAPDYLKKGKKVQTDITTISGNLTNIATTIRTVAQIIYEAELEAWRIAHERD